MAYRVWSTVTMRAPDGRVHIWGPSHIPVRNPQEGYHQIKRLREWLAEDGAVEQSLFGLEVADRGHWKEWYDDGGLDVLERYEGIPSPTEKTLIIA